MNNRSNIKLVATDIDGVWTDAKMHYTENGDFIKENGLSRFSSMSINGDKAIVTLNLDKDIAGD